MPTDPLTRGSALDPAGGCALYRPPLYRFAFRARHNPACFNDARPICAEPLQDISAVVKHSANKKFKRSSNMQVKRLVDHTNSACQNN